MGVYVARSWWLRWLGPSRLRHDVEGYGPGSVAAVTFPVEVRDASMASATFLVPRDGVAALLPPGLEPVVVARRWGVLALVVVDYRDTDLGSYHEIGTCFLVQGGAYIHRLPVDGDFTMRMGRELWGFPKWLTTSELSIDGATATCHLMDGDEHILTLSSRGLPRALPGTRAMTMHAFSSMDGVVRRTPWTMRHTGARPRPGGTTVVLGERHPMARELRALGLPKRAAMTTIVDRVEATFGEAEVIPSGARVQERAPLGTSVPLVRS